jgi:hypothetical protein
MDVTAAGAGGGPNRTGRWTRRYRGGGDHGPRNRCCGDRHLPLLPSTIDVQVDSGAIPIASIAGACPFRLLKVIMFVPAAR